MTARRTKAWGLVAVGAALLGTSATGMVSAVAQDGEAPALSGYSLVARAPGFEFTEDQPSAQAHPEGQGTIGETTAELTTGTGYALSSVAWPGAIGGNLGTLMIVLGGDDMPPEAKMLNYPIRAEARAGQGDPDVSFDQAPGTTMDAHADPARSEATAAIDAIDVGGVVTVGNLESHSKSTLTDSLGTAEAQSVVGDISIGGVIEIASVTSTAKATTDGTKATTTGETVVKGLKIAGVEAKIDKDGVHFAENSSPLDAVLRKEAMEGLEQAGFTIAVSEPTSELEGPNGTATSGALVFLWEPPDNPSGNIFTITLGGASAVVGGAPGLDVNLDTTVDTVPPAPATDTGSGSADLGTDTGGDSSLTSSGSSDPEPATSDDGGQVEAADDSLAAEPISSAPTGFTGITAGWALLGLAGAAAIAQGLRRVGEAALIQTATVCDLEGG